jgi:nucleoside-diphosphate-sugar epimerase
MPIAERAALKACVRVPSRQFFENLRAVRRVLVTGASGFVGAALCPALARAGHRVRRALRRAEPGSGDDTVTVADIGLAFDWSSVLTGIDTIVHLAGRAHVMRESGSLADPYGAYRQTNVVGTEALARAAVAAGVRRLVFASSIKVNGESTASRPFRESDPPAPEDDYGRSKREAEERLRAIASESGLEVVIVRPPLVYGPGVKGNIARLIQIIDRGIPLPLGAIDNRRSLIGLTNLTHALRLCVEHEAAAGETFLVADDEGVSTPALIRAIANALRRPARLLRVPTRILEAAAGITGSGALARLIGSLEVDSRRIRERLGWRPAVSMQDEIAAMVHAYHNQAGPH